VNAAVAVAVRVLVVLAAVALLWTLSPLVGSREDTTISAPVDKAPVAPVP
jgi:hypothetical protein